MYSWDHTANPSFIMSEFQLVSKMANTLLFSSQKLHKMSKITSNITLKALTLLLNYGGSYLVIMVDHTLLLKKLQIYGLTKESLLWFTSYLKERRQFVKLGDKQSDTTFIYHSIPQGSILGPLLFTVFINDLPLHVTSSKVDLYADDTTLTSSMNHCSLGKLHDNLNSNKLPINEEKTKAILITGKRPSLRIDDEMNLTMNGSDLELVPCVKLLGAEIDHDLSFTSHVDKICKNYLSELEY